MKDFIMKARLSVICLSACFTFLTTGCNDWLDVTPQAQVSADKIFSTPEGYESVLYGIYISMTEGNAYGQNQTYGLMDVLAQYYDIYTNQSHALYQASVYNYTNGDIRDRIDAMWLNNYNTIANCNILLEHLAEQTSGYFTRSHYNMLKGEALAIRAYLHFDMLRAFALNYQDYPDAMGIPYADSFVRKIHPQLSSKEVLGRIVDDLKEAQSLLTDIDPCFDEQFKDPYYHFVQPRDNGDIFESYRAYRMNYFAVTGLLARVYDYMGEPEQAYECAKYVIDKSDEGYFTFTDEYDLATDLRYRDVIMQNELLFALDGIDVKQLFYQADAGSNSNYALLDVESLYPDADDFRHYCVGESSTTGRTISYKYYKTDSGSSYAGKIPMIRLSEMYLIAANAVYATNPDEAVGYLTTIRKMRGASQVVNSNTYETFLAELTTEARREFLGEGQMFYWYKRHGLPVTRQGAELTLTPTQTCLPMPANEVEFGDRIEDYLNL